MVDTKTSKPRLVPPQFYETPTSDLHFMLDQAFADRDWSNVRLIQDEIQLRLLVDDHMDDHLEM